MGEACGKCGGMHKNKVALIRFSPKERDHLEELRTDGRLIVHGNLKKLDESLWIGLIWQSI
jgi:hypothetical protein